MVGFALLSLFAGLLFLIFICARAVAPEDALLLEGGGGGAVLTDKVFFPFLTFFLPDVGDVRLPADSDEAFLLSVVPCCLLDMVVAVQIKEIRTDLSLSSAYLSSAYPIQGLCEGFHDRAGLL